MRRLLIALGFALVAGAAHAEIGEADWKAFLKASYEPYRSKDEPASWETRLFEAVKKNPTREAALAQFAQSIGQPRAVADAYAETILLAVANNRGCAERGTACGLAPGQRLRVLVERNALGEPSGELLRVVGQNAAFGDETGKAAFLALIADHPKRIALAADLWEGDSSGLALAAMIHWAPADPRTLQAILLVDSEIRRDTDNWSGWLEAVLETGERRAVAAGLDARGRAIYAQALTVRRLALGMNAEAAQGWLAYPAAVRALAPIAASGCTSDPNACDNRQSTGYWLVDNLAAALWTQGRKAEARELLAGAEARIGRPRDKRERQRLAALNEAIAPARADAALFDLFLFGEPADTPPPSATPPRPGVSERLELSGDDGWMGAVNGDALSRLVAARLDKAGYPGFSARLLRNEPYGRWNSETAHTPLLGDIIDADVRAAQARWTRAIEAGWAASGQRPDRAHLGGAERAFTWTEARLPAGVAPWRDPAEAAAPSGREAGALEEEDLEDEIAAEDEAEVDEDVDEDADLAAAEAAGDAAASAARLADQAAAEAEAAAASPSAAPAAAAPAAPAAAAPPRDPAAEQAALEAEYRAEETRAEAAALKALGLPPGWELPVPATAVIRYERDEGEQVILYQSSDFDLPGEIPAYGVWMARTRGGQWDPPVYLGIQSGFPYQVTPGSAVPILADGKVRIEVRVREIDPASITFPPVGLRVKRSEDGVLLETTLAELERDGDNDGLTDAAERRLGLDPAKSDTDGDGVTDGRDPVPLTAWDRDAPAAKTALANILFRALFNHDAGAIVTAPAADNETTEEGLARVMSGQPQAPRLDTLFLVGDPDVFAGVSPPFRLMVYTREQADRLPTGGAPFFPPEIVDLISSLDGKRHYVVWSAGWVGGTLFVDCSQAGPCAVKELSSWIT